MTTISQDGHADKLEYGWWEPKHGHILLPKTLGDKRNYVLSPVEVAAYDMILMKKKEDIETESAAVTLLARCLRNGRIPLLEQRTPRCFTLANVLEFKIKEKRTELEMMKLLLYTTKRAIDGNQEREQVGPGENGQSAQRADS